MISQSNIKTVVVFISLVVSQTASAETLQVWFHRGEMLTVVERHTDVTPASLHEALRSLAAGPTAAESADGFTTAIPAGTTVTEIALDGDRLEVQFSSDVLGGGLGEARLEALYRQVSLTARPFHSTRDLRLMTGGRLLSEYLPVPPTIAPQAGALAKGGTVSITTGSLSGRSITLSPGHGFYWNGGIFTFQRPVYCSPLNNEDLHNLEMSQYLENYLLADGMIVKMVRCTNQNYGTHLGTGRDWWQMAGYLWLQHLGYPCSVYGAATGCQTGTGETELSDEIWSRPLASDLDGTDIYISLHTNGYGGNCTGAGCPTGTEMYYDASGEHAPWGAVSQTLANNVSDNVMSTLLNQVDSTWTCTSACVKNSNGAYGEIRIPDRAAILIELGYHDTCDRDADTSHLRDNFFRSASMWAIYKGVCDYFGTTPTWDFYSCEYVSDTIPASLQPGESRSVNVTFRNRGVLWKSARGFRLGAVGDSDPLSAANRINMAGEIGPGSSYSFAFTLTAPMTPGVYTSDWQMMREGYTWFGPVVSQQIVVGDPPTLLLDEPFESYADQAAFAAAWNDTGTSPYVLDAALGNPGQSLRMPSPANDGMGRYFHNLDGTYQGTDAEPLVLEYDLYLDPADSPTWTGARHFCELRGYTGGSFASGSLQNMVAIGLNTVSVDAFSSTRYQGHVADGGVIAPWRTLDAQPAAPSRSSGWHRMKVAIKSTQVDFSIDGNLAESVARTYPEGFNCVLLGSDLTANGHQSYVDNLQVYVLSHLPVIAVEPTDLAGCAGATAAFTIQAIGHALSYQWQLDGTDLINGGRIGGTQSATLSITNIGTGDLGEYRCVVTNSLGAVTSYAAQLTLRPAVTFPQQPQPVALAMGSNTSFATVATGDAPLTYRWYLNGQALADTTLMTGAFTATLTITDARANNVGTYTCQATTPCGTLFTDPATLTLTTLSGDFDNDGDVDMKDFGLLQSCLSGQGVALSGAGCSVARLDQDGDLDQDDVGYFQQCLTGPNVLGTPTCVGP